MNFFYKEFHKRLLLIVLFLLTFFVISLPWINVIFHNWSLFNLRAQVVSIQNVSLPYHNMYTNNEIMSYQIITSVKSWLFLMPFDGGGSENPRYVPSLSRPVSMPIVILFLIGFFLALIRIKDTFLFFMIFLLGIYFGQIVTVDPPNGSRGLILLPIIYIFAGLTLEYIKQKFNNQLITFFIIILSILVAYTDFSFYQNWMTWIKV